MIFIIASVALAYQEVLTIIPIDSANTMNVLNFSDSIKIELNAFNYLSLFPLSIIQILQKTPAFSIDLAWGAGDGAVHFAQYKEKTSRTLTLAQSGLSGYFQGKDWTGFKDTLSGALSLGFSSHYFPIEREGKSFFFEPQFLCKENFEKILNWLPCRESGLSVLFDQLLNSKYLNVHISASRTIDNYSYTILVSGLIKGKLKGELESCNTKVEVFNEEVEEAGLDLNEIRIKKKKEELYLKFSQKRWLVDEEHGFSADFYHEFINNSTHEIEVEWFEHFPVSVAPLLSCINARVLDLKRSSFGWVLRFSQILKPGRFLLRIKLDKQLLGFEEYPNDPQRGWDIIPSPVFVAEQTYLSNGLLVMIPEPDFSMPFNVICITGSALAFFFTSFQNLQTWKDSVHWSNEKYESSILRAKKRFDLLKNVILGVSLAVLCYLDHKGIIKMFG